MKYPALEATLGNIVHRNPEIRFSDAWLKSEAKKLSSELSSKYGYKCKVSSTWLRMFKLRHGIKHGFCPVHYDGPLAIWKVSQALGLSTGLYVDNTVAEKGDRALQKLISYPDDLIPDESLRLAPEIQANDSKFAPERRRIRALKRFFADKGCPETNRTLTRMLVEELHLMGERLREEMWEDRVD
ncbi:hypothetical protein WOLCODRAFT_144191 [Wolfiporia cocos MD-104 SS10]|uniref:HTH CENPB-type domain-containing protein n=1 Tax=Wolfiporia cocos (strain MD-104) TaxID=742152 RepID=A0A2H3K2W6_WOLCO|nr:hypothetical protein WOLCODRAFT_144191 [Wolfiporia cocos MD-104 SS10]